MQIHKLNKTKLHMKSTHSKNEPLMMRGVVYVVLPAEFEEMQV